MKWLLCLMLIGLGLYSYQQSQTIDTLTSNLKDSNAEVADLKRQVQASSQAQAQIRAAAAQPSSGPTPAARPSWMNTTSDLDRTPVSTRRH